ncbi:MAG: glycosyl hydrolase [Ignavibacteria bacterium]|nr:glycosyl hydrolase [Ignavibacteria bacterium]
MQRVLSLLLLFVFSFIAVPQNKVFAQTKVTSATFGMFEGRQIGPTVMSGRVTAIDAVNKDTRIIYVGAAAGGVWKSITGGTLWKPVFDKYTQSIGDIRIDQKNPETIWVGTGESNMRNSVSVGDGLYKSVDAGESWKKVGLDGTEHISKIEIDPSNSDVVYVAAPGPLWGDSPERGLYKTMNGGTTWEKVLFIDDHTGCADVMIDPKDPNVVYASMWDFRRKPWSFSSGGPGSGLYKSTDGGVTWNRIDKGFTDGLLGRIILAMSPSDSKIIYAIAEAKSTALFKSTDGGETWTKKSSSSNVTARPFYFSVLKVDPTNSNRLYRPAFNLSISDDAGESWYDASTEGGWVHSDLHALWINPHNSSHMLLGTDGGVYMSFDKGNNWMFLNNLPLAQYYHIATDMETPYHIYGGLQDNGSWVGPSSAPGGVRGKDWEPIGFGDGFWVQPDLTDISYVYWESQGGNIQRLNRKTSEVKDIKPQPLKGESKLRFNWNTPIYMPSSNPGVLYMGAQYLFRSTTRGDSWERISGDLTTNDPEKLKQEESGGLSVDNSSAENHCTIFTVAESPIDKELIFVGTDDGNVQISENGGKSWRNVAANISGLPRYLCISSIEPSRFDRSVVYITVDGHAMGDMNSYVYKTSNLGKTWTKISTSDIKGFAHKVKEDLVNKNLLFTGTEFGAFMSINGGMDWVQLNSKIPNTPVRDIVIHPVTNDLVLGTHGRGVIIVDDITGIRNLSQKILDSEMALIPTRPTIWTDDNSFGGFPNQAGNYRGANPNTDALILYYLKERPMTEDVKVLILDDKGEVLQTIPGSKRKGLNKVYWDMRMKPPKVASGARLDFGGFNGPEVLPGVYKVKLVKGDKTVEGTIEIKVDPKSVHSQEDRDARRKYLMDTYKMSEDLAFLVDVLKKAGDDAKDREKGLEETNSLKNDLGDFFNKVENERKNLTETKEGTGIIGEEKLRSKVSDIFTTILFYYGKPSEQILNRYDGLLFELNNSKANVDKIFKEQLPLLNKKLKDAGKPEIIILKKEKEAN